MGKTQKVEIDLLIKQLRTLYWEEYQRILIIPDKIKTNEEKNLILIDYSEYN